MKKVIILILFWLPCLVLSQQAEDSLVINNSKISISGGMGIAAIYTNDLADYLNSYSTNFRYRTISTAPLFFLNCEYRFSNNYGIKLDYSYMLKTYNVNNNLTATGNIDISYYIHSPAVLLNYIISDKGYLLKFGAGISYNYVELENMLMGLRAIYKSTGFGLRLDAHGHTQLGEKLYLIFALGFNSGLLSDLERDSGYILSLYQNTNMSFAAASINFGLAYYF